MCNSNLTGSEKAFIIAYITIVERAGKRCATYRRIAREMGLKSSNSITQFVRQLRNKGYDLGDIYGIKEAVHYQCAGEGGHLEHSETEGQTA